MPNQRWISTSNICYLMYLVGTICIVIGNPIGERVNLLREIEETNWSRLADEWLASSEAREDVNLAGPLLPFSNNFHKLPPIAETVVINGTDEFLLAKLNYSTRMLWDKESTQPGRYFSLLMDKPFKLLDLRQVMREVETSVMSKVSCTACKFGAQLLQDYIKKGRSDEEIKSSINQFCVSLRIQSPRVCRGITALFGGEVIYVLKHIRMNPKQICSFIIGDACDDEDDPQHDWEVEFPPVKKPPIQPPISPQEGAPTFKVLHISDTHYDPYYQEGTNADCNEPLCCRLTNGAPLTGSAAAGKWGDYRKCDTPKRTVDHMMNHIAETHSDIDYILWTGDLPPHDVWNQTREENLKILRDTVAQMIQTFPKTPIFPALGNHESAPVNSFPPPFVPEENSISWLYDELDKQWRRWLPAGVSHTVRRGAFYSVLLRPGFRIIAVNMNYCNNKNWWLLINSTDPVSELQWLVYELQNAETKGEKVHIIGHIPPGHSDCLKVWSRNYYQIINRYESTIAAQFFGHTHYDEFQIFYDTTNLGRALSIAYIGPSVSPYFELNPGYRIYYVDGDHSRTTRMVVDHESWIMNLKEANLYDYPTWHKMYSARQAYQMPSLLPKDWDALIDEMNNKPALFDLYYKHYYKNSPVRPDCDKVCQKRLLCDLKSGRSHDRKALCQSLESRIDGETKTGWKEWIYNGLSLSYVEDWFSNYSGDINTNQVDQPNRLTSTRLLKH